jgi:predicted anti-sigma-YlaC factor YlaD
VSGHVTEELALALVTLPAEDPERALAEAHAQGCTSCRALLEESEAMLRMLDADHSLPAVSPALKARVRAAVLGEPARARAWQWQPWALALGTLLSLFMVWLEGQSGELAPALGVRCALFELGGAVLPFALVGAAMLRGVLRPEPLGLALSAMGGALVAQSLLLAECPAQGAVAHSALFHFGGVVLAALLGYAGGRMAALRVA